MSSQLERHLQTALPRALTWLERMVAQNSFTLNRPGIDQVGQITAACFAELGFASQRVPSINPRYGDHLVLTRPGLTRRSVGLISHLDTVYSAEEEQRNGFHWRPAGDRIYGPGTMDIKGGTILLFLVLSALREVAPEQFAKPTWIVLLNSSEEVLSQDFGSLCQQQLGPDPLAALVFEAGGLHDGWPAVVTARKGRATFRVRAQGRGAHAGSRHERGANAIVQLAEALQRLDAMTDYSKGLTFNVGTIAGGSVVNCVPSSAVAEVEMRTYSPETYREAVAAALALNGLSTVSSGDRTHRCQVTIEVETETPPWPNNPGTEQLYQIWCAAAGEMRTDLRNEQRGGVSDANYLWTQMPTLDGLGPYGDNAHCSEQTADGTKEQEYVDVTSFVPRAALSTLALIRLLTSA